jgi:single-strand DNA-binding protein
MRAKHEVLMPTPSINRVQLLGHLGKDPDLRYTNKGQPVCNLWMATKKVWKKADGTHAERTDWHAAKVWGKFGEICASSLHKGSQVYLEGELTTFEFESNGVKKRVAEIAVSQLVMCGRKGEPLNPDGPGGSARPAWPPVDEDETSRDIDQNTIPF